MSKRKIDVSGEYGLNPFVTPLLIEVTSKKEEKATQLLERVEYIKVFRTPQGRGVSEDMSVGGRTLRDYIMFNIGHGEDIIKIDPAEYMGINKIKSAKTLYVAANELQRLGVIAPVAGKRSMYWINPAIFFVGSRPNKYKDNVVVRQTIR